MTAALITLVGVLMVLVSGGSTAAPGRHRAGAPGMRRLRPVAARLHLAEGTVDDNPLENGSRYILVRDGHRARMVST